MRATPTNTEGTKTFHIHGNRTSCTLIVRRDGDGFRMGIALLSEDDQFNRKTGRQIAFTRLFSGTNCVRAPKQGFYHFAGANPEAWDTQREEVSDMFMGANSQDISLLDQVAHIIDELPDHLELTVAAILNKRAERAA